MVSELEAAKAVAPTDGPESVQILWSLGSTYATLDPPRKQEAIQMLKGFTTRACKELEGGELQDRVRDGATRSVARLGGRSRDAARGTGHVSVSIRSKVGAEGR